MGLRGKKTRPVADRLPERLRASGDCLEFVGAKNAFGYGIIRVAGKNKMAHRVAWEIANGQIPEGMLVCHRCDNPPCCNAAHLFIGTQLDNVRDMWTKDRGSRFNSLKTHCPHGHPYEDALVIVRYDRGGVTERRCRSCQRAQNRRRRRRASGA